MAKIEKKVTVKSYLVQSYAKLVIAGKATLDEDNQDGLRFIPKAYHEAVAEWIADYEERKGRE